MYFWENLDDHWELIKKVIKEPIKDRLIKNVENKEIIINLEIWTKIVYDFLDAYCKEDYDRSELIKALGCLYFGRIASFYKKNGRCTPEGIDKEVIKRAKYLFKKRNYFLDKI